MAMSNDDKLVYMVNQIARNFAAMSHDDAVVAVTDHLIHFWDPRMKARIVTLAAERPGELLPVSAASVAQLAAGREPAPQTRATAFAAVDEPGRSDAG